MKQLVWLIFLPFISLYAANCNNRGETKTNVSVVANTTSLLIAKATVAAKYCERNRMNLSFCILANMKEHSGKVRIYVWDLVLGKVLDSGLVSHGCGNNPWSGTSTKEKATFSNVDGSHCSSLGKYRVGKRGYSQWGINVNYLLHGLEDGNSNAFIRQVVLHSWDVISENPVYPNGTPEGWGCPAISNMFMTRLDERLKKSNAPVLLWMF